MTIPTVANTETGGVWLFRTNQVIGVLNQLTDGTLTVNGSIVFTNTGFSLSLPSMNIANNLVLTSPTGGNTLFLQSSNAVVNGTVFITGKGTGLSVSNDVVVMGNVSVTKNVTAGNVTASGRLTASNLTITSNLTSGNIVISGNMTANNLLIGNDAFVGDSFVANTIYANDIQRGNARVITSFSITTANGIIGGGTITANSTNLNLTANLIDNFNSLSITQPPTANALNAVANFVNGVALGANAVNYLKTGGTISGPVVIQTSTGGWGTFNAGHQLLITTPGSGTHPAIGITDVTGARLWGIINLNGALRFDSMPDYANTTVAAKNIITLSNTGMTTTNITATGRISVTQDIFATGQITTDAQFVSSGPGGLYVDNNIAALIQKNPSGTYKTIIYRDNTDLVTTVSGTNGWRIVNDAFTSELFRISNAGAATLALGGLTINNSGSLTLNGGAINMNNNTQFTAKDTGGTYRALFMFQNDNGVTHFVAGANYWRIVNQAFTSELFKIDNIGRTFINGSLTVNGSDTVFVPSSVYWGGAGQASFSGVTTFAFNTSSVYVGQAFLATSDRRSKENIIPITEETAIKYIKEAKAVTFTMKRDGALGAGFIAQDELKTSRKYSVIGINIDEEIYAEGDTEVAPKIKLNKNYVHDIAYLTAALQYALREIEELKNSIVNINKEYRQ